MSNSIINGKYVVLKVTSNTENLQYTYEEEYVPDAVVIRRQDIFASSGFYAYAQAIMTAIEMVEQFGYPSVTRLRELREIADYFMNQGDAAKLTQHKLPD